MASGWFWPIPFQVTQLYICLLEKPILIRRAAKVYVQHLKPNNRSIHHITAISDPSIAKKISHNTPPSHDTSHDISPSSMDWLVGENLNQKPMGFYHQIWWAFRFQFSHHPILFMKPSFTIIHHPPHHSRGGLQGLFQLAHLSVHRGQRRLQRGQGTASDLSHGEAMAHRNRWFKRFKLFLKCWC